MPWPFLYNLLYLLLTMILILMFLLILSQPTNQSVVYSKRITTSGTFGLTLTSGNHSTPENTVLSLSVPLLLGNHC